MSAPNIKTPFLLAALLVSGGLACHKPALAPAPEPVAKVEIPKPDTSAEDKARAEEEARRRVEAEQNRKAEQAAEAARKAAAMKESEYRDAAKKALIDIQFAFDKSTIKESDKVILTTIADFMKTYPQANVAIDGNCDERGTVEYNLPLGERRARAAMDYLEGLGVASSRLSATSYGKEKPLCTESVESCWSRNRRSHFELR